MDRGSTTAISHRVRNRSCPDAQAAAPTRTGIHDFATRKASARRAVIARRRSEGALPDLRRALALGGRLQAADGLHAGMGGARKGRNRPAPPPRLGIDADADGP